MIVEQEIPIFFSSDDNYVPYLTVAIQSLKEHSNKKVWWICSQGHEYILKGSAKRGLSSKRGFEKK